MGCGTSKEINAVEQFKAIPLEEPVKEFVIDDFQRAELVMGHGKTVKQMAMDHVKTLQLDEHNKKILDVVEKEGWNVAAKTMISEFTSEDGKLDYAAMRGRYG